MKKMNRFWGIMLLLPGAIFAGGNNAMEHSATKLDRLLPDHLLGWEIKEEQHYTPETLYDYIDGGAELYLSYGFRELLSRVYQRPEQPDIYLDIFDMGNAANAFGVFSHSREKLDSTFGQGSQYSRGSLFFWKDRYYISLLASPETPEARQAMFTLARQIDQAIPHPGPLPEILHRLPREFLVRESIRYFYHPTWLNSYFFLTDANILHLDSTVQALWAKFKRPEGAAYLLLVLYPSATRAEEAEREFREFYFSGTTPDRFLREEKGTWAGLQRCGRLLAAVFRVADPTTVRKILEQTCRKQPDG